MAIRRQVSLGHFRDSIHGEKLVTIFYFVGLKESSFVFLSFSALKFEFSG